MMVVLVGLTGNYVESVSAASPPPPGWDRAQRIIVYTPDPDAGAPTPYAALTASNDGIVHIFWRERLYMQDTDSTSDTVWYVQVDEKGIHDPVDVLVGSHIDALCAGQDESGQFHLLALASGLVDIVVPREDIANPRRWMESPRFRIDLIAPRQDLARDSAGGLHLVYPARRGVDNNLLYTHYQDERGSWAEPSIVSVPLSEDIPVWSSVAVDGRGRIHVAWTVASPPDWYPPTAIYYARSTDGGHTWSFPREVAGRGAANPSLITVGNDEIHLAWGSSVNYSIVSHQWSGDGGVSWTSAQVIVRETQGLLGPPAVAVDSAGVVHLVTNSRDGAVYLRWQSGEWTQPVRIWERKINQPRAIITEGNRLHVTFTDKEGLVYLARETRASHVPPMNVDKEESQESNVTRESVSITKTSPYSGPRSNVITSSDISLAIPTERINSTAEAASPITPLIVGGLGSLVLLVIVSIKHMHSHRRT